MLTVRQIFNDLAGLVGIEDANMVPESLRERILGDIRAALQLMQQAGEDYYCRQEENVSLLSGTSSYELAKAIQTVLEPARLSTGQLLKQLTSRSQFNDFGPIFLGQTSRTVSNSTPLAYFAETLGDPSSADSVKIMLHVAPTPSGAVTLILNVIKEPPTYSLTDLCGTSPVPPVPHQYHESILLPLARYNITTCWLFDRFSSKLPQIKEDYERALNLLGLSNPRRNTSERQGEILAPPPPAPPPQPAEA